MSIPRRTFIGSLLALLGLNNSSPAQLEPRKLLKVEDLHKLRIWKVTSNKIKDIHHLADILMGWDGKSDLDIIWGPDLEVTEFIVTPTDLNAITQDLGIQLIKKDGHVIITKNRT